MKYLIMFILTIFVFSLQGFSETLQVPAQYKSIQEAINNAQDGDVVLVAEGTYFENINFIGKKITVASHFFLDQNELHINNTIINGSKPANPDNGSVVNFISGEDTNSVLCGFTVTGGTGTVQINPGFPPMRQGAGIYCNFSAAKIINNRIIDNTIENTPWAMGGGFYSGPPFIPTYSIIENNFFSNNKITGGIRATGGGIYFNSAGRIINNVVENNIVLSNGVGSNGGGIALSSWNPAPVHEVIVEGNKVLYNKALQSENAFPGISSHAGGLTIIGSRGVISNNVFMYNEISPVDSGFGAGVVLDFPPDDLVFKNNIVAKNFNNGPGKCYGGGLAIWDGNPTVKNNLIIENKGTHGGAVWTGFHFCNSNFVNNTIVDNIADVQGGAFDCFNSNLTIMNSIMWRNDAPIDAEICLESGSLYVSYCDISGGYAGTENFTINPMLMPLTHMLNALSPCVDAGNPDAEYNDPAHHRLSIKAVFPSKGTIRNDLGAYGGSYAADWRVEMEKPDRELVQLRSAEVIKIRSFPNPFNHQTRITFTLNQTSDVTLDVYNILGQNVAVLANQKLTSGLHNYLWNAENMSTGVYFINLEVDGKLITDKILLIK